MATASTAYSADPAFPVLADDLLRKSESIDTRSSHDIPPSNDWSLENEWKRGFQPSREGVFRSGVVLGISRLRTRSDESYEYTAQFPRYLLISHLRNMTPSHEPNTFIIYPGGFEAFAPRKLLGDLQSPSREHPGLSREESIQRLDSVQLLPVHSFFNAAQAIGKVSDMLLELTANLEQSTESESQTRTPIILIVAGLDYLTEHVIRTANPIKGAALLTALLRTVTRLSRVHASYLSVMLVNTSGLGPSNEGWARNPQLTSNQSHENRGPRQPLEDGIYSIFHSDISSLFPTLLMKTLDQGIDTHLLLSNSAEAPMIEVIKDRMGTGLGKWGTWEQQ